MLPTRPSRRSLTHFALLRHAPWRPGWAVLSLALVLCVAAFVRPAGAEPTAQASVAPTTEAPPSLPPPSENHTPAQDITIEGLGFSKLVLGLKLDPALSTSASFRAIEPLLEKDLCYSGVFNLMEGHTRHCPEPDAAARADMQLALTLENNQAEARLYDTGPEHLQLFQAALPLNGTVDEHQIMDLVNQLTQRVTGQPGLLGSTIGFALKQPGYAKVIVATTTQGRLLRLFSHDRDINILPRFNRQGTGLVYTVLGNRGSHVYYENLDTKNPKAIPSFYLMPPGSLNSGGAFSPDGTKVIVTMSQNENADLFLFDLRNRTHTQITSRPGIETQANWSPDGKQLLFVSDRSGTPQVYVMDLSTHEDIRLTFDGLYNADPKWSPDGRWIIFTKRLNSVYQIFVMDQYGENVRQISHGNYWSEQAEWSPDGRQIVFASNRTGEYKLYVVSADGSGLRRLTETAAPFAENSPTWTVRQLVR